MRKFNPAKPHTNWLLLLVVLLFSTDIFSQTYPTEVLLDNGPRNNRIKLVFLSDGYKTGELGLFKTNAQYVTDALFLQAPFKQYKKYFNSYLIKVPSPESGAKHPANAIDESSAEQGHVYANPNNNFGSIFDEGGYHRLLVAKNEGAVFNTLATNFPDFSQAFILVNSEFYGGSGGTYATASADQLASEIAIHEMGHSFAGLADEYWIDDVYASDVPANMTSNGNKSTVKWKKWVNKNGISVYPYGSSGSAASWFRPHNDCKMQNLGADFCAVCTERFIDVIHDKVSMIDAVTPSAQSFILRNKEAVPFSISTVQTEPKSVNVRWYLNNSPTPFETNKLAVSIPFNSFKPGKNFVRAQVIDNTPLSQSYVAGLGYVNETSWNVEVSAQALPVHLISFSGKVANDAAIVNWEIDSPDDLQVFELEKSIDGLNFAKIASISGEDLKKHYSYTDPKLFHPTTYYRLKTIEKTGLSHYSNIIQLQSSFEKFQYKVYQNAESRKYHLSIAMNGEENVSFRISDIQGRLVSKKSFGKAAKQVEFDFDLNGKPSGIYYMNLFINNSSYTIPLIAK